MEIDDSILQAALIGFSVRRGEIAEKIAELERKLAGRSRNTATVAQEHTVPSVKRTISAKGRAAIGAATKKRWAEFRKARAANATKTTVKKAAPPRPVPKRKLSPAAKAKLVANLAKARAAKAAKKTEGGTVPV
uniref:R27-2 protein n=1 Tax=Solibacter usitatus (strain Ellin6076) TaxID=234267 RepID=Q01RH8_SOLUE